MKKIKKRKRKFSFLLSLNAGLVLSACFFFSSVIVLAVIRLTNLVYRNYFKENPFFLLVVGFLAAMAVGTVTLFFIMRIITKKFDSARNIISKIADGDYSEKLPLPSPENILYDVVIDFNKMVDRLNATAILQSDFASHFSHEFKTPLVSVKGYAELLERNPHLDENDRRKYLKIIIDEADRLAGLASSTLLISKLESEKFLSHALPVRVDEQIEECILLLDGEFRKKNIDVEIDLQSFSVKSEADMLKEVWINLLSNAVKYGREGGVVKVRSLVTEDCYIVSVEDDGIGMNEKTQAHIFERYYQGDNSKDKKGNGLGLSIARKIVEMTGGNITVKSAPGKGSVFSVVFPKT